MHYVDTEREIWPPKNCIQFAFEPGSGGGGGGDVVFVVQVIVVVVRIRRRIIPEGVAASN